MYPLLLSLTGISMLNVFNWKSASPYYTFYSPNFCFLYMFAMYRRWEFRLSEYESLTRIIRVIFRPGSLISSRVPPQLSELLSKILFLFYTYIRIYMYVYIYNLTRRCHEFILRKICVVTLLFSFGVRCFFYSGF